jgi:choline dehydrogenase-like flavoprotein
MIEDIQNDMPDIQADICIIGAGAAGITVARALQKSGMDIVLLESGGTDYESDTQDLAKGEISGLEYYDLRESRLRFFGGTTAIWGGRSAALDAIDFEKRDWVAHSGWPFAKDVLRPYYRRAQELLGLTQIEDNQLPDYQSPFDEAQISAAFWQFDEIFDRFTQKRCGDLIGAQNIRIFTHAHVMRLNTSENGSRVETIDIGNLKAVRATLRAQVFVMATGGIEASRLLLASKNPAHPHGIGNNTDQVGRYFMEHPHARAAQIMSGDPKRLFKLCPRFLRRKGQRYGLLFRPSDQLQRQAKILNTGFTLAVRRHAGEKQALYTNLYNTMRHELSPTAAGRSLWKMTRRMTVYMQDRFGAQMNATKLRQKNYGIYAIMRAEQAPNPNSRITLSDKQDELGMPLPRLDWRLSEIDKHSVSQSMKALDHEIRRLNLGHVDPAQWLSGDELWEFDPLASNHAIGGYHHMGGARMSADAKTGVVDGNCRVHGVENLYVASSAVFPTSGWANPTLTILALALRLGDHLQSSSRKF